MGEEDGGLVAIRDRPLGKIWEYRLSNKRNGTQTDANEVNASVNRPNGMQSDAKERSKLEDRWAQARGGSSPSPSVSLHSNSENTTLPPQSRLRLQPRASVRCRRS